MKRVTTVTYYLAVAALIGGTTLASCGDDEETTPTGEFETEQPTQWDLREQAKADVEACIVSGGQPFYTSNLYGVVVEFLGCHRV